MVYPARFTACAGGAGPGHLQDFETASPTLTAHLDAYGSPAYRTLMKVLPARGCRVGLLGIPGRESQTKPGRAKTDDERAMDIGAAAVWLAL